MLVLGVILFLLAVLVIGMGFFLADFSMKGKRQTLEEARAWQEAHYDFSWYDPLEKTDYQVMGEDGYVLHVRLLQKCIWIRDSM